MDSEQQHASADVTADASRSSSNSNSQERLALIELEGRDGRPQRLVDVHAWPVTLGRAIDNDIVIDDPHVAAHHARLKLDESGHLTLEVLDSGNGVQWGRQHLLRNSLHALPAAGTSLQLGLTQLRLRLPGEVLAPEKPLPVISRKGTLLALAAGALMAALEFGSHWLSLDPGADYSSWVSTAVGLPVALVAWCALWALLSKLFRHRFDFMGHLRIVLPWLLGLSLTTSLWPQLCATLDLPALWHWAGPLNAVVLALMVRSHLAHALPAHPRAVTAAVAASALAWGGISLAGTHRATDRFSALPYMSTLPLPALRWAATTPSAALVADMAPLADRLAQRVKKAKLEDRDDSGSRGEEED